MSVFKVFIGWDSREEIAYEVCKKSIEKHTKIPVDIEPLQLSTLKDMGIYWRPEDPLASTDFAFSRFLVPYLMGYQGLALFVDCDFLFRKDISEVFTDQLGDCALACVHHNYVPTETTKMDGKIQTTYPRKNWSSFMLFNCAHPKNRVLTPDVVNAQTGSYLHRFQWLEDCEIGEVDVKWNYLEGWNTADQCPDPSAVHFTRGGPWFENWADVEWADEWRSVFAELNAEKSMRRRAAKKNYTPYLSDVAFTRRLSLEVVE